MRIEDIGKSCRAQAEAILAQQQAARCKTLAAECDEAVVADPGDERDLQRACEHELHRRGVWALHLPPRVRISAGCPDLLFPHPRNGQFCGVELKSAKGRLSAQQVNTLDQIARCNGRAKVVRSYEEFVRLLEE